MPERRRQRFVLATHIIVGVAGGILELPVDDAGGGPFEGLANIGVVDHADHDLKGVGVYEVVAEASVEILIGGDGWHDVSDADSCFERFFRRVVGVENTEFVLVGVAEEGAADGVIEAIDDLVVEV